MTVDSQFEQLLVQCGVNAQALAAHEREALDVEGFVLLREMLDPERRLRLCASLELELTTAPESPARHQHGTRHLDGLPWKDEVYDVAYAHPRLLAAVLHVLRRPFRVLQLSARDPQQGFGQQGLHTDWLPRQPGEPDRVVTALWLLDDFLPQNGATRLLPRSHRQPHPLANRWLQPHARHPGEQLVLAPAGSVLVFNGHLYHGGTTNRCGAPRRALQCQFVACDSAPPGGPPPPERLPPVLRALLGGRPC